jgi:hypothetical protein
VLAVLREEALEHQARRGWRLCKIWWELVALLIPALLIKLFCTHLLPAQATAVTRTWTKAILFKANEARSKAKEPRTCARY